MILIAFRHSDTRIFSRIVTGLRGGDSAHVESAIPSLGDRLSLCVSSSFMDGGVRGKVIDLTDPHKWRVYQWTGEHADIMKWLRVHYKAKYDKRGLIGILAPAVGHSRSRRFCSEAVAEHLRLPDPHTYDLVALENFLKPRADLVVWRNDQWVKI